MPAEVGPGTCDWGISHLNGDLCFGMPATTIPGEVTLPSSVGDKLPSPPRTRRKPNRSLNGGASMEPKAPERV